MTVAREQTGAELIKGAVANWALPSDTEYALVNVTKGKLIHPECCLDANLISEQDELEIQPVLVAGGRP